MIAAMAGCRRERVYSGNYSTRQALVEQENDVHIVKVEDRNIGRLNDVIDSVIYIPLSDEYLVGNMEDVIYADGTFFVLDKGRDCVVAFDEHGNFKKKISSKGRSSKEYLQAAAIRRLPGSGDIAIVDDLGGKFLIYNTAGEYKETIMIDHMFLRSNFLTDTTFVFSMGPWQNESTQLEHYGLSIKDRNNEVIDVAYKMRPVQIGYCGGDALITGAGRLLFKPIFSDSLFVVTEDKGLRGEYYFDIEGSVWEKHKNSDKFMNLMLEKGNCVFKWIFETDDLLLAYTDVGKKSDHKRRMSIVLYDRKKRTTRLFRGQDMENIEDLEKFAGYDAAGVKDGWIINQFPLDEALELDLPKKLKSGEIKLRNKHLQEILEKCDYNSNPVLALTKFKL